MTISILVFDSIIASPGSNRFHKRGYVYIEAGRVKAVAEGEPPVEYEAANLVAGGEGRLVLPGFVTAHTHLLLYPLRHVIEHGDPANDPLAERLAEVISEREAYLLATLSIYELTLRGVTLIQAVDVHAASVWRAMRDAGVNGVVAVPVGCRYSTPRWREEVETLASMRVRAGIAVCREEFLDEARRLASQYNLILYIHPPAVEGGVPLHAGPETSIEPRIYVPVPGGRPPKPPVGLGLDAVSISSVLRAAMIAAWQGLGYEAALVAATRWGAQALGFAESGVIEPNATGDIVIYDLSMPPGIPPRRDTLSRLLLDVEPRVEMVITRGAPIVDQGEHLTIPRQRVEEARRLAAKLLEELKPS